VCINDTLFCFVDAGMNPWLTPQGVNYLLTGLGSVGTAYGVVNGGTSIKEGLKAIGTGIKEGLESHLSSETSGKMFGQALGENAAQAFVKHGFGVGNEKARSWAGWFLSVTKRSEVTQKPALEKHAPSG
jgi:hypothetical protein